jgi:hypothetical protein
MRGRSRSVSEPDLFSIEPAPPALAPAAEAPSSVSRTAESTLTLSDVGRSLLGWSDDEIEQLRRMVTDEACRRGLLPAETARASAPAADLPASAQIVRRRRADGPVQEIGSGQISAIRAVNEAGMKLGKIAREFRLPLAAVKRVLATSASA